jgi:uncharacterized protein (DUF2252 family)
MGDQPQTLLEPPAFRCREERIAAGKQLRIQRPRGALADWRPAEDHRDPIDVLEESNRGRIPDLIPIRYGRMLRSPFTFLRGSAGLMASDLARLPATGIKVQACGDCHLLNFGMFATPERRLVFDINDFDETLPAPWEWDVARLAASFVVAGRDQRLDDRDCRDTAVACARAYREHLREYSQASPLEVWYTNLDMETLIENSPDEKIRKRRELFAKKARERIIDNVFPKIVAQTGGRHRFVDRPPLFYHADTGDDVEQRWLQGIQAYRQSLSDERRVLLDRYRFEDCAQKVVGIGSVGTRCAVALFFSEENHPLILQVKEAVRSVLEPYTLPSAYENQGQRVVVGQRLMQSSSDIFLGWARGRRGNDFYVRQLRDMKFSVPVEGMTAGQMGRYAAFCGQTLARAHAKSGDSATISGYLGKRDQFDEAVGTFAVAYADQTERDHAALIAAEKSGRIQALIEDEL